MKKQSYLREYDCIFDLNFLANVSFTNEIISLFEKNVKDKKNTVTKKKLF